MDLSDFLRFTKAPRHFQCNYLAIVQGAFIDVCKCTTVDMSLGHGFDLMHIQPRWKNRATAGCLVDTVMKQRLDS